ncbi:unnamed protein product, partial [Discosporangium mesarthrocarpum]
LGRRVVWLDEGDRAVAFEFDVPVICLHAISRDQETFPSPCLYCQVLSLSLYVLLCPLYCKEEGLAEEEEDVLKEAFFSPEDSEQLQGLFDTFSRAAEMNPDPPEPGQQAGDDELIFNQER